MRPLGKMSSQRLSNFMDKAKVKAQDTKVGSALLGKPKESKPLPERPTQAGPSKEKTAKVEVRHGIEAGGSVLQEGPTSRSQSLTTTMYDDLRSQHDASRVKLAKFGGEKGEHPSEKRLAKADEKMMRQAVEDMENRYPHLVTGGVHHPDGKAPYWGDIGKPKPETPSRRESVLNPEASKRAASRLESRAGNSWLDDSSSIASSGPASKNEAAKSVPDGYRAPARPDSSSASEAGKTPKRIPPNVSTNF
jgi:hypothetical protein